MIKYIKKISLFTLSIFMIVGCKESDTIFTNSTEWIIKESESKKIDFLEQEARFCTKRVDIDEGIYIFNGERLLLKNKKTIYKGVEVGRADLEREFKTFKYYPPICNREDAFSVRNIGNNTYFIDADQNYMSSYILSRKSFGTGVSPNITAEEEEYKEYMFDYMSKEIANYLLGFDNVKEIISKGGLKIAIRFSRDSELAEASIYSVNTGYIGNHILFKYSAFINDIGRNSMNLSSLSCKNYQKEYKFKKIKKFKFEQLNKEKGYKVSDEEVLDCKVTKLDLNKIKNFLSIIKKDSTIEKSKETSPLLIALSKETKDIEKGGYYSLTLSINAPEKPLIKAIPFGDLLNPDLAPEIVKKYE